MTITDSTIQQVWNKARVALNNDPNVYRKDQCGAWIQRSMHGRTDSVYGWEIDHIQPISNGGSDDLSNLRPLHWLNNRERQNGRLSCPVTSSGVENVRAQS